MNSFPKILILFIYSKPYLYALLYEGNLSFEYPFDNQSIKRRFTKHRNTFF